MNKLNSILLSVLLLAALGLIAGLGLAVASELMAVPVDETSENIRECLPGANCGACGFSGCDGYATALSNGETKNTALCAPGGEDTAIAIAKVLGVEADTLFPMAAFVRCNGTPDNAKTKLNYSGVKSCKMASQLFGGQKECVYGCIGYGDCVAVCDYGAASICDGVARINPMLCTACQKCIKTCPKNLIELIPLYETKAVVVCRNQNKGAFTRKECKAGCIGCMKCVKVCEQDAITVENNNASIDYSKCIGCKKCESVCPTSAIHIVSLGKN
ncbi:MAG: RnfABCDGE type electron transport complex subunit B [Oscillospiraceae bacterium]